MKKRKIFKSNTKLNQNKLIELKNKFQQKDFLYDTSYIYDKNNNKNLSKKINLNKNNNNINNNKNNYNDPIAKYRATVKTQNVNYLSVEKNNNEEK